MDKIKRYRPTQVQSFEDFFNTVTDLGLCQYCDSYNECEEAMGKDNMEAISGNGCRGFDASIDALKKHFLLDKCATIGT